MFAATLFASTLVLQQPKFPSDPNDFQVVTEDLDRFWKVFDSSSDGDLEENLRRDYFQKGTPGLAFFNLTKIQGPKKLADSIRMNRPAYEKARERCGRVKEAIPRIRAAFFAMKYLYPEAQFPPIYCVIGRFNSGGTANTSGMMLGMEMPVNDPNQMASIAAHELVHTFQKYRGPSHLLSSTIKEGAADFIGSLASGGNINQRAWAFGLVHEKVLWEEWKSEVAGKNRILDWIGTFSQTEPRPGDLGYFLGARICDSYFRKASDKRIAIREIIECTDPAKFVRDSGYDPKQVFTVASEF